MNKKTLSVIAGGVVVLWLLTWVGGVNFCDSWEKRGQFGDLFGSANALFSGLAFVGLIYAIVLQKEELGLQREELRLQRDEMAASRKELSAQVQAQRALFLATLAQVRVAAEQARLEAIKMDSEKLIPSARKDFVKKIEEVALKIDSAADEIQDLVTG